MSSEIIKEDSEHFKRTKKLWEEFKKFVNRGNVVDMAVGVVIGGAFNTIVKAFTAILLSLCTWGVPGGLDGLITVLPPLNPNQMPKNPDWEITYTGKLPVGVDKAQYVSYGNVWCFKGAAVINWGAFINAVISFLIIALTLFVVFKTFNVLKAKREELREKAYLKLHADEIAAEKAKEEAEKANAKPEEPVVTEKDVLVEIRDLLKTQQVSTEAKKE